MRFSAPLRISPPVSNVGTIVLGTPIGDHSFVSNACIDIAKSGSLLCGQLPLLEDAQSAMLLLRHATRTQHLCHLMRNVPPDELHAAALLHDLQTRSTFTKLLNLDDIMSTSWAQVTLLVRYGGFGLISALQLSPKAFLASWVHSLKALPERFVTLKPLINTVISHALSSGKKERSLASELQRSLQPGQVLTDLISDTKKL